MEGLITFKRENRYDPDNYEIFVPHDPSNPNSPEAKIGVFDKVTVEITVEKVSLACSRLEATVNTSSSCFQDKQSQRGRVKMYLVHPVDSRAL